MSCVVCMWELPQHAPGGGESVLYEKKTVMQKNQDLKNLCLDPHYLELSVKSSARERGRQGKEESCTIMCCVENP